MSNPTVQKDGGQSASITAKPVGIITKSALMSSKDYALVKDEKLAAPEVTVSNHASAVDYKAALVTAINKATLPEISASTP